MRQIARGRWMPIGRKAAIWGSRGKGRGTHQCLMGTGCCSTSSVALLESRATVDGPGSASTQLSSVTGLAGVWRTRSARSLGPDGAQASGMVGGDCAAPVARSEQLATPLNQQG